MHKAHLLMKTRLLLSVSAFALCLVGVTNYKINRKIENSPDTFVEAQRATPIHVRNLLPNDMPSELANRNGNTKNKLKIKVTENNLTEAAAVEKYNPNTDIHLGPKRRFDKSMEIMLPEAAPKNPDAYNYIPDNYSDDYSYASPDPDAAPEFDHSFVDEIEGEFSIDKNHVVLRPDDEDEIPAMYTSKDNKYADPAPEIEYN